MRSTASLALSLVLCGSAFAGTWLAARAFRCGPAPYDEPRSANRLLVSEIQVDEIGWRTQLSEEELSWLEDASRLRLGGSAKESSKWPSKLSLSTPSIVPLVEWETAPRSVDVLVGEIRTTRSAARRWSLALALSNCLDADNRLRIYDQAEGLDDALARSALMHALAANHLPEGVYRRAVKRWRDGDLETLFFSRSSRIQLVDARIARYLRSAAYERLASAESCILAFRILDVLTRCRATLSEFSRNVAVLESRVSKLRLTTRRLVLEHIRSDAKLCAAHPRLADLQNK